MSLLASIIISLPNSEHLGSSTELLVKSLTMQLQKEPLSEAALQKIAANLDKIAIGPFDDPESERFIVAGEE